MSDNFEPDQILDRAIRDLQEQHKSITTHLAGGSAKDYAEYRELCGKLHILTTTISDLMQYKQQYIQGD